VTLCVSNVEGRECSEDSCGANETAVVNGTAPRTFCWRRHDQPKCPLGQMAADSSLLLGVRAESSTVFHSVFIQLRGAIVEIADVAELRGWLRGVDLNHRPLGYEPNELPDCSTPQENDSNGGRGRQTRGRRVVSQKERKQASKALRGGGVAGWFPRNSDNCGEAVQSRNRARTATSLTETATVSADCNSTPQRRGHIALSAPIEFR
jgi:hypothetical protein